MNKYKTQANLTIFISALSTIIEIFSGPFLTAYFIKTSSESIFDISIYKIYSYIILGLTSVMIGKMIKNKFKIGTFRIGIVVRFFYILSIILLKEKVLNYLWLLAILHGFSTSLYYMPYNLFISHNIKNENRTSYEVKKTFVSSMINILIPIFLGAMITITNYRLTAMVILVISMLQIVLSFFLTPMEETQGKFKLKETCLAIKKDPDAKRMMLVEFLVGLTIESSALIAIITILVYNAFETDLNLGIITAISYIIQLIIAFGYGKYFKNKKDGKVILLSCIMPVITLLLFLLYRSNVTIIIYQVCFSIFINLLSMIRTIRLYNVANTEAIHEDNQVEFWSIREVSLNLGRVMSFVFLLIAGVGKSDILLNLVMIGLTLMILVLGNVLRKVKRAKEV